MRAATLLWSASVLLAGLAVAEYMWPDAAATPPPASPQTVLARAATRPASQAGTWVADLLARPPFAESRRPVAGEPEAAAESDAPPRLAGIMVNGDRRSALFATGTGRAVIATEGTRLGAFEVQAIKVDEVVLAGPDGPRSLHPRFASGAEMPPPPPPLPQPAVLPQFRNRLLPPGAPTPPPLLPPPADTDSRPFAQRPAPSGAAIFGNAPALGVPK